MVTRKLTQQLPAKTDPAQLAIDASYLRSDEKKELIQVSDEDLLRLTNKAAARALSQPETRAARTIQLHEGSILDVNFLAAELREQVAAVNSGDMKRPEAMLVAQAHTLDALFCNLSGRAHSNMVKGCSEAVERYMKLALRAQNQCRTTIEALSAIKNPPVVFAKQMNVSHGHQQVNNGVMTPAEPMAKDATHTHSIDNEQNKLSRGSHELLPDTGASQAPRRVNPGMETVGEIHRAEDRRGKGSGKP